MSHKTKGKTMQVMKLSEYKKQHDLNNTHLMNLFNEPSRQNVQNWCKNGWYVIVNADHNDTHLELVSPKRRAAKTLTDVKPHDCDDNFIKLKSEFEHALSANEEFSTVKIDINENIATETHCYFDVIMVIQHGMPKFGILARVSKKGDCTFESRGGGFSKITKDNLYLSIIYELSDELADVKNDFSELKNIVENQGDV